MFAIIATAIVVVVANLWRIILQGVNAHQDELDGTERGWVNHSAAGLLTVQDQNEFIQNKFQAADPSEQEWCKRVLNKGTFWKGPDRGKGAQFSQDVFTFRRLFFDQYVHNTKGFYVEAGANHYRILSSTYFFDKCLGWDGLCVEPQVQYHQDIEQYRSCKLVKECLSTEKTDMMIGGMPKHRGGGMFVKPIPENGIIPENWDKVECEPLDAMLQKEERTKVDLMVLDVEGAEMMLLETINWDKLSFGALLIENNKMNRDTRAKLDRDMDGRGYHKLHQMRIDALFVPHDEASVRRRLEFWQPDGDILQLQS